MLAGIPETLGRRYQLLEKLGQGGMGTVFRAFDRLTGQHVALKRVHAQRQARALGTREVLGATLASNSAETATGSASPGLGSTAVKISVGQALADDEALAFRLALAQEFRTLASLRHPNIISVLEYGFDTEDQPYFTMELLAHTRPLLRAVAGQPIAVRLDVLAQALRALDYLHRRGILHRDIKPSNVLLIGEGCDYRIKLLDFGLALEPQSMVGAAHEVSGTLGYIAPEVLRGEPVAEAADLYAMGVLAYELIAGHHPFSELDGSALISAVLTTEAPPLPLGSSAALADWVLRLLARAPEQRFASAAEALRFLSVAAGKSMAVESSATRESFLQAARFIGRETELRTLREAMEQMQSGHGAAYLVGGESGVGKSRLLEELRTLALVHGVRVLRAQAEALGNSTRQQFLELLRGLVLDVPLDELEASVIKTMLPELPALLNREISDPPPLRPQEMQRRSLQVLLRVLMRPDVPTLMILDDLQWATADNIGILREVVSRISNRPLLVVGSFRDDECPDLPQRVPGAGVLKLRRLDTKAIGELSKSMLGPAGQRPEVLDLLVRETEGNVYFIVEAVRALAEEAGSLAAVGTRELPRQVVAGGIRAVVQRRLARLPEWARLLLCAAAVAGRQVDLIVFRSITPELDAWLQVCLDASVLEVHDAEWRFSHDKLREGLLESLSAEARRRLHQQIGDTVERVHGATDAHCATLAFHFEQALDIPKAARFTAQSGAAALRRGALHESVVLLERAKNLQEQADVPLLERTATLRRLVRAYYGVDRHADCMELCREGMESLGRPMPKTALRRLLVMLQETGIEVRSRLLGIRVAEDELERTIATEVVALNKGIAEVAFRRMDEALLMSLYSLHAAELSGEIEPQINWLSRLGYAAYVLPLHRLGKFYFARAARLLTMHPEYTQRSDYYPFVSYLHAGEGNWRECIHAYSVWLGKLQHSQDKPLQCLAYCSRSSALLICGRLEEALEDAQHCEQIGRKIGSASHVGAGLGYTATVGLHRGAFVASCELFREAQSHLEQSNNLAGKLASGALWSLTALRAGQLELAVEQLDKALQRMAKSLQASPSFLEGYEAALEVALHFYLHASSSEERAFAQPRLVTALYYMVRFAHKFPIGWPRALLTIGRIFWIRGHQRLSLRTLSLSLRSAESRGMPYAQALAHLWLGRVLIDTGDGPAPQKAARTHWEAAVQLLSAGGYSLDLQEVQQVRSRL